ncbi:hypothetical protein D3874_02800 [Oleomonas cavernae]|uniref:RidA family protein n=1 Tax=Oleomonas cavernae TaxID=2320859 RepID=A0A418WU40_9PROT|nr:Rid family hydrolase [Oleomonas cavernae]RJF94761.1 hypothetical protein D3874_02800 [Oleomonas cavernae]
MITTSNPESGYFAADVFDAFSFSQSLRAGNTVYYSGVAPLRGTLAAMELVGKDDMKAQTAFVLGVLGDCLAADGFTSSNLAALTIYTTRLADLMEVWGPLFKAFVGDHRPTTTHLAVSGFVHPDQMLEITAIAVDA